MPSLTPGDGQDLLARLKTAAERRDVDLAMSLFREDAEYRPDPFAEPQRGRQRHPRGAQHGRGGAGQRGVRRRSASGSVAAPSSRAGTARTRSGRTAERMRSRGFMTLELDDDRLISRWRGWTVTRSVGRDATFSVERPSVTGGTHGG